MFQKTIFDCVRCNIFFRKLAVRLFRLRGWKIEGKIPKSITKCVIVAAPHTTGFDLPYSIMLAFFFGLKIHWIGKKQLFFFPFKSILLCLGGIPVDRAKRGGSTSLYGSLLKNTDEAVHLVIAPAGTRKNVPVEKWHRGFYDIALNADVHIICGYIDYKKRVAGLSDPFLPSGDYVRDLLHIKKIYEGLLPAE